MKGVAERKHDCRQEFQRWRGEMVQRLEGGQDPEHVANEIYGRLIQTARKRARAELADGAIPISEMLCDKATFLPLINGALRSTIEAHGPITEDWIGSASKRIWGQFKNYLKRVRDRHRRKNGLGKWSPDSHREQSDD